MDLHEAGIAALGGEKRLHNVYLGLFELSVRASGLVGDCRKKIFFSRSGY